MRPELCPCLTWLPFLSPKGAGRVSTAPAGFREGGRELGGSTIPAAPLAAARAVRSLSTPLAAVGAGVSASSFLLGRGWAALSFSWGARIQLLCAGAANETCIEICNYCLAPRSVPHQLQSCFKSLLISLPNVSPPTILGSTRVKLRCTTFNFLLWLPWFYNHTIF